MKRKMKWIQPALIMLSRGRPEENVLLGCKTLGIESPQRPANWNCRPPMYGICLTQANS
ncbi:MAG: hypothetical protein L6428_03820 [Candidatus Aminicenantes bacterium]|nr:hypothetical protein [Acidobacteriota bacterium]MCG2810573.1 hypothetical protein [Candidatus Aminicenantes bacterium]